MGLPRLSDRYCTIFPELFKLRSHLSQAPMLTLPRMLTFTPSQFAEVCDANPEAVLELDADGTLIEMTPTGGSTSARKSALLFQLQAWARTTGDWIVGDSSAGFRLPDGSVRSPEASLVRLDRWRALSDAERDGFPPLCPDLVVQKAALKTIALAIRDALRTKLFPQELIPARIHFPQKITRSEPPPPPRNRSSSGGPRVVPLDALGRR